LRRLTTVKPPSLRERYDLSLRKSLSKNKVYILDAGYGQYSLFEDIRKADSNFLARLRDSDVVCQVKWGNYNLGCYMVEDYSF
jgi:hypothetical protein